MLRQALKYRLRQCRTAVNGLFGPRLLGLTESRPSFSVGREVISVLILVNVTILQYTSSKSKNKHLYSK